MKGLLTERYTDSILEMVYNAKNGLTEIHSSIMLV